MMRAGSVKTKAVFAVAALLCVITPCLTISCSHTYTCTLDDIDKCPKLDGSLQKEIFGGYLPEEFHAVNKSTSDNISLFIWCDSAFSEGEIKHLGQLGIEVDEEMYFPPRPPDDPWGMYLVYCKVGDICRLVSLDKVKRISSGDTPVYPQ